MNQQEILTAAKQGHPQAIALILNHAFSKQGIRAKTQRKGDRFLVLLEADPVPDAQTYCRLLRNCMLRLNPASVRSVYIYGRQAGHEKLVWGRKLSLQPAPLASTPSVSATVPIPSAAAQANASTSSPSKIRRLRLNTKLPVLTLTSVSFAFGVGSSILSTRFTAGSIAATEISQQSSRSQRPLQSVSPPPSKQAAQKQNLALPITIKAVGDMVPGTSFPDNRLPAFEGKALFQHIQPYLQNADVVFGNFESTFTHHPYTAKDTSRSMTYAFRTPPAYAMRLKEAGFDVLSVANNHSMDFAEVGFADTIQSIEKTGMQAIGQKGKIVYRTVKGQTIAWIGFSYLSDHNNLHDLAAAKALVKAAQQKAQVIVISVHAGAEGTDAQHVQNQSEAFYGEDRGNLVQFAHSMIDAGADLILGHGPHVVRAIELYKGKLIAYSLGNFLGYRTLSTEGELSTSLILQVKLDTQGNFMSGRIIPARLTADGIPTIDESQRSVHLIRWLTRTDFPQTPLKIDANGNIAKQPGVGPMRP